MDLFESEDLVPKIEKKEETKKEPEKPKLTKEEIVAWWKKYYDFLESIYPITGFEIQGRDGETLYFHRRHAFPLDSTELTDLVYILRDNNFKEEEEKRVARNLRGELPEDEKKEDDFYWKSKGFIRIDKEKKIFNFLIDWDYQGKGYGKAIYDNYLQILETLGIEDKEDYELQVANRADHSFIKYMHTKQLVARTNGRPNAENAISILEDFAKYPNTVKLSDVNAIVGYAMNSNVSMEEIAQALNENGFNIHRDTIRTEELEKFRAFGITGLKATCMHTHFMKSKSFEFMQLITEADEEDTTLEFKRVFEELKRMREEEKNGGYVPDNMQKYEELGHIILDWKYPELLFRNVKAEVKKIVKRQAIAMFEQFDPEHKNYSLSDDANTCRTLSVLKATGLMDKDAYIALYQKALNRNYDLEEFDNAVAWRFIDGESRRKAREEISQHLYCPYPKKKWQKSYSFGEQYRISKVEVPQKLSKKGNVRDILKQEIIKQGTARKTKIKTDMAGIGRDGKPFIVDNLKDWLFGVPGAHGNLQMMGTTAITFPPQTPKIVVEMVEQVINGLVHPDVGGRNER